MFEYVMEQIPLMFPSQDQDQTVKNDGQPNNIEPSVMLLQKYLDTNIEAPRDACVQFTNKKATCFAAGGERRPEVFLQSTNELTVTQRLHLHHCTSKPFMEKLKKNSTEEARLTITILLFSPGDKYKSEIFCTVKGLASE